MITGFHNRTKVSLAHFLPQGTPTPLIPILVIIETISLFIQPVALAVQLTANITAGYLLIHLIGGTTLALISINTTTAFITFIILTLLTILEFAFAIIQAYVFTLLVSLYLHDNNNDPPDPHMPHSKAQSLTPYRSPFGPPNNIGPNHVIPLQLNNTTNIRLTN